jgi:magnesium transporter
MPANVVNRVLRNVDFETRKTINHFLTYPENSAGSLMTIEMVDLHKEMTVSEAINYIKKNGVDKETINNCYVTDQSRKLEGTVTIRKLILSDKDVLLKNIMDTNLVKVNTFDDQEEIAELFKKYDYTAIPVVDKENCLVGIITIDDIVDIIEQENTEDFQIMAAIRPSEEIYLKTPVLIQVRNRISWLLVLMVSAFFTGAIIEVYEDVLQSVVVLASFIPMLMNTAGIAGTQSSTIVIRSIALGEVRFSDAFKVLWVEFRVSFIVGIMLSIVNFLRILLFANIGDLNTTKTVIAFIVSASLFATIVLAKTIGCLLPIIAKKLKIDPAIMSAPLITTIVDALSLIIYFMLSSYFLKDLLGS